MTSIVICALYKFVRLEDFEDKRQPLLDVMTNNDVRGTLLLANEGINGTVSGTRQAIDALMAHLNSDERFNPIDFKESYVDEHPFYRTKVKLKKEIVTMGVEGIDPKQTVGTYLSPTEWNELLADPEVVLIDTRNDYEFQIGTFEGAINPNTESFRQFPKYVEDNLDPQKHKKVAMFCTGGIRCEKSTAYLKEQGFDEVYHLKGGILKYLEEMPEAQTKWQGECFVFDNRVAVNHKLEPGQYDMCSGCRMPLTAEDKQSEKFQAGISCHYCFDKLTEQQKQRFAQRQRQIQLAKARGEAHLGDDAERARQKRRQQKQAIRQAQQEAGAKHNA